MWNDLKPAYRYPVLILGMLSLVTGVLAGIGRLGTQVPVFALEQIANHGVLMVPSFFGTVIGLERAVAIGQRWAYIAPLLTGIGGGAFLLGIAPGIALMLLISGSFVFLLASFQVLRIQQAAHNWMLVIAAICLFTGNIQLFDQNSINQVIYWWMAFLLLTIAGERLELSRLVIQDNRKRILLVLLSALPVIGIATSSVSGHQAGIIIFAAGNITIAIWLLLFDIARRTVLLSGLTRFTAISMLAGYVWLLISAVLLVGFEFEWNHISRDSVLHSFFLGFVFSMVIGHALIIFPAVTGLTIPYSSVLYLPLILLQLSLLLRISADLSDNMGLLKQSGIANGIAIAIFIATLLWRIANGFKPRTQHQV